MVPQLVYVAYSLATPPGTSSKATNMKPGEVGLGRNSVPPVTLQFTEQLLVLGAVVEVKPY